MTFVVKVSTDFSIFLFVFLTSLILPIIGSNLFVHAGILPKIAQKYNVTVDQLKIWNKLSSENLQIGQQLIVGK